MKKTLSFICFFFTALQASPAERINYCGYWRLQNEGIYDGFILSANYNAQILSIEKLESQYYVQGNIIHIPHTLGGEFLLEIKNGGKQLKGQDFWTKGTYYEKESDQGCN